MVLQWQSGNPISLEVGKQRDEPEKDIRQFSATEFDRPQEILDFSEAQQ